MKLTLFILLILGMGSTAMATKMSRQHVMQHSSVGEYKKPGAAIDIKYTVEKIDSGEVGKVSIILTTPRESGKMSASISIGKGLQTVGSFARKKVFQLSPSRHTYTIDFKVVAGTDGLYYIRIGAKIGRKTRHFAIPVSVGTGKANLRRKPLHKSKSGENMIIFKANETIR